MIFWAELAPEELPPDCGNPQHFPSKELMTIPGQHAWKCPGCSAVLSFVVYAKDPE